MKKMYIAHQLCYECETNVPGWGTMKLRWNGGQIGALPVFVSKAAARKAYGKDVMLTEIQFVEKKEDPS